MGSRRADIWVGPYFLFVFVAGHRISVESPTLFEEEPENLNCCHSPNQQNHLALERLPGFFRDSIRSAFQWFNSLYYRQPPDVNVSIPPSAPDFTLDLEMERGLRNMVAVIRLVLEN